MEEASGCLYGFYFLETESFIFGVVTCQYVSGETHIQNPEENNQMAPLVPSEVPTYGVCVKHTIACLGKKVSLNSRFQSHEML